MGYLIAYLLLALAIDLLRELVNPTPCEDNPAAVRRRLWSDTDFDCCTKVFAMEGNAPRQSVNKTSWHSVGSPDKNVDHGLAVHTKHTDYSDRACTLLSPVGKTLKAFSP